VAKSYNTLKLSLLFAKFLYQHKQLNLPGIGVFTIDPAVTISEVTEKNSHELVQHIRFSQKNIVKPDEEFIEFIRTHTGKIRPLAESDLESFLSDGKILLNIGKPFHLEGIGTLQKNRAGAYEFYPGLPLLEKLENFSTERDSKSSNTKQPSEQNYNLAARNNQSGKMVWIVLAILVGLTAIIWGGYSLYNSNTDNEGTQANKSNAAQPISPSADTTKSKIIDSTTVVAEPSPVVTGAIPAAKPYKFIFRLASKNYVIKRYNDLKTSNPSLNWDTKDSVVYRLYVSIPAAPSDTARIRDSLRSWYGTKKIIIEQ
jgi:hypothetical protein